jgi:uncharacterized protein VirK/YbjX
MFALLMDSSRRIRAAHGLKKAKRFVTSYIQYLPHSARWLHYAHALYRHYHDALPPVEMLRSKFTRGYYSKKLSPGHRLKLLLSHYAVMESYLHKDILAQILAGAAINLATFPGKSGETYALSLSRHERFQYEGELTIQLSRHSDAQMLAALTFSMPFSARQQITLRIGGLQGPSGEQAKQVIVQATKDMSGARPKAIVLDALYAIANALDVEDIEAVCMANHPLKDSNHVLVADNDSFWSELASGRSHSGDFRLPAILVCRSLEEVPAKKRKDWLARKAVKAAFQAEVRHVLSSWMRYHSRNENVVAENVPLPPELMIAAE